MLAAAARGARTTGRSRVVLAVVSATLVATLTTAVPRYTRPDGNPDGTVLATCTADRPRCL